MRLWTLTPLNLWLNNKSILSLFSRLLPQFKSKRLELRPERRFTTNFIKNNSQIFKYQMESDPLGEVCPLGPAPMPTPVVLKGRVVSVVPMDPDIHSADLFEATRGKDHLYYYLFQEPSTTLDILREKLIEHNKRSDVVLFTIIDKMSLRAVGHCQYMRIDTSNRVLEIGNILYVPSFQKTIGATEAMYLLIKHAIEDLGYRRYEWKCNAINTPSRRAALRLGFSFDGIFRQHMILKGHNRDTAWFSIIDKEWPLKKKAFEQWLSLSNFNEQGQQIQSLSEIRNKLEESDKFDQIFKLK